MTRSAIIQQDYEDMVRRSRRMTPEERLVAFFHHSQLIHQLYQAGARYRLAVPPPSKRRAKKR